MKKRFSMKAGEHLVAGDYLVSANQVFFAMMQEDGNLCVYRGNGPVLNYGLLWSAGSARGTGPYYLAMQADGNLCVYKGTPGAKSEWVWSAQGKALTQGDYYVILQDDGNLCVYLPNKDGSKQLIWQSALINPLKGFHIHDIHYHLDRLEYKGTSTIELYRRDRMVGPCEWSPYSGPGSYTNSGTWEDGLQLRTGEQSNFVTSVPIFENKKVLLGPGSHRFVWNGESFIPVVFELQAQLPLMVEDQHILGVIHKGDVMHYEVPYTLKGESVLEIPQSKKDGKIIPKQEVKIPFEINGLYKGNWLWDRLEAHVSILDTVNNRNNRFRLAMKCVSFI